MPGGVKRDRKGQKDLKENWEKSVSSPGGAGGVGRLSWKAGRGR